MTTITTLEGPLASLREREIDLINDVAETLTSEGPAADDDRRRLRDIARDLSDMFFMVAVIGEFNSGKSTFVNALLGERLLPMGITPTTEYIELIRYAEEADRNGKVREDGIREWAHPHTGAEGVAIVDTPGTGSVFERHEKTAKEFLHRSDLLIFVISAKQAFAETERTYLEMAQRYGKKVILVVNQTDLLDPGELQEVRSFIKEQIKARLGLEPLMFMVSARNALATGSTPTQDAGGIDAVKAHLRGVYAEAPPAKQKLLAQLGTAKQVVARWVDTAKKQSDKVTLDINKVRDVQRELEVQSLGLETQMKEAGVRIEEVLEGVRKRGLEFIDERLNVRRIGRGINRQKLQEDFQEQVIGRSLREINESTGDYINAVVDQSRLYWRSVIDRLNQLQDLMEEQLSGLDSSIYAEQRATLQEAIRIAEAELKSYSSGRVVADMEKMFHENSNRFLTSSLLTISGIIAAIVAVLTPGPLIGTVAAPAAPLALPVFIGGAAVAAVFSIPAIRYLNKLNRDTKNQFNERVDTLIDQYKASLDQLTTKERNRLTQYGNQILNPIFSRLEVMSKRYNDQQNQLGRYLRDLDDLRERIQDI